MTPVERLVTDQLDLAKSRLEAIDYTTSRCTVTLGVEQSHALLDSLDEVVALVQSIEGNLLRNTVRHLTTPAEKVKP